MIPNFVSQWLCKLIDIAVQINRELGGRHLTEVFPFIRSDKKTIYLMNMNWIVDALFRDTVVRSGYMVIGYQVVQLVL